MCLGALKIFLYKEITETTRFFNILSKFPEKPQNINDIEKYSGLILPLKLFYLAYNNYNYYKERSFCDELIDTINNCETIVKQILILKFGVLKIAIFVLYAHHKIL